MRLLKVFLSLCVTSTILLTATAETHVAGPVSGVWTIPGSPYIADGNLNVPANSTLLIEPGVEVIFSGQYVFQVYGKILAIGSKLDSIRFTAFSTWYGFEYETNPDTSQFDYCYFEKADNVWYGGAFELYEANCIIEHSTFYNNHAQRGGAIYSLWSYGKYTHNVFKDNSVTVLGGALNIGNDSNSLVEKCLFHDNSSSGSSGGALYLWDDHSQFINCTIVQNTSPAIIASNGSTSNFKNCIFWYNSSGSGFTMTYSDVEGGYTGIGNINQNPAFHDPNNNDFHLQPNSPCIDTGDPASPLDPDGTRADMGCYFYDQGATTPVILASFSGGFVQSGVELTWATATEIECYGWVVERAKNENFEAVSPIIPGSGTSTEMHEYTFCDQTANENGVYLYRLKQIDLSGYTTYFEAISVEVAIQPVSHKLVDIYPNPFNPTTEISIQLPTAGHTELVVYDVNSREVATLVNGYRAAGAHTLTWNAQGLPSGLYFCRLQAGTTSVIQKLVLLK